jgi:hypothetical protein
MDTEKYLKNKLLEVIMANPSLSEDIDYKPDPIRKVYYRRHINGLTPEEIRNFLIDYGFEIPKSMEFIVEE